MGEDNIVITHEKTKEILKKPYVVLAETDNEEELLINGKSVCCHKRLYPFDVLGALQKCGIINLEYKEGK